jgi:amidase
MTTLPEYDDLDATGLAALIRSGDVSPTEVLQAAVERIAARDPALNAVVHSLEDRARARVDDLPEGPLTGVPFLIKDLKLALAGTPTSDGCAITKDWTPDVTSVTAARYEAAGLQILGKTNTPEFGIMAITESKLRGPCRNPWNTDHTPGGSSGGAAAAVAARMVPIAHAGDGGGSIRIPASACGLVGLKPTRGRVTQAPFSGESWGGFVQEHVVSRTVRDSALLLDLSAAPTPGEPYGQPAKARPWLDEVGAAPGRLRVAFTTDTLYAGTSDPACIAAVQEAVKLLEELGHDVVEAAPTVPVEEMVRAYFLTVSTGVAWMVEKASQRAGRRRPRRTDFEPATWLLACAGRKTSAPVLLDAQMTMQRVARDVAGFFEQHDVFVTSTMARPPAKIGELYPSGNKELQLRALGLFPLARLLDLALETMGTDALSATPNTQLFNQTGQPGISLPLHWTDDGLPVGVQFVSRFGDEATLFRLAAQLEAARPWVDRRPPLL